MPVPVKGNVTILARTMGAGASADAMNGVPTENDLSVSIKGC